MNKEIRTYDSNAGYEYIIWERQDGFFVDVYYKGSWDKIVGDFKNLEEAEGFVLERIKKNSLCDWINSNTTLKNYGKFEIVLRVAKHESLKETKENE